MLGQRIPRETENEIPPHQCVGAVAWRESKILPQRTRRMRRGRRGGLETIDDSRDAVPHMGDIEVKKVSEFESAELEIANNLSTVNGKDGFNSLELDHDALIDEQVNAVAALDHKFVIPNRQQDLRSGVHALLVPFERNP